MRPITIVDVAHTAGVSVSTVSRVVRNHRDVRDSTRRRVERVIEELGYRPSPIARALVSGRSPTLGLLVSDITNPFYPELAKSIEQEAKRQGYAVIICNTGDDVGETEAYLQRLIDHGVEGVIHASVGEDEDKTLALIGDTNRIIFANRQPQSRKASYIVSDNAAGSAALTRHLLEMGHRRIGFVQGPQVASVSRERVEGFLRQMALESGAQPILASGDFSPESGARAVEEWMREGSFPTAIIGVNDLVALGAFDALLAAGLRVPEDAAVAGFDDIAFAGTRVVGLTSVAQHIDQMGTQSVRLLLRMVAKRLRRPIHEVVAPELIVRRSTSTAATSHPSNSSFELLGVRPGA